ncbi:MAG TPA: hypothetical protein VMV87_18705 [Burkholderiales bacterium]|nr:hypothetical protein [Burkholderiales bacterium]
MSGNTRLNPVMAQMLKPFAPKPVDDTKRIELQAKEIERLRKEIEDIFRLPFPVDLSTSNRLEDEREVTADPSIVRQVIDQVIEDNLGLIEGRVIEMIRRSNP